MMKAPNLRSTILKVGPCSLLVILAPFLMGQEVEGNGKGTGALFSPADYMEISTPLTVKVGANFYGFYLGNVEAGRQALWPQMNGASAPSHRGLVRYPFAIVGEKSNAIKGELK